MLLDKHKWVSEVKFNIKEFVEFRPRIADVILVVAMVLLIMLLKFFGINEIPENSLVENMQLVVLALATIYCLVQRKKNPEYGAINTLFAMILFLMVMREISYGRCIFCQVDGNPHEFYSWSHYKYGYLANIIVLLYVAVTAAYAFVHKFWLKVYEALKTIKFPFVSAILLIVGIAFTLCGEKVLGSTFIEENAEFLTYCTIFTMLYYYNSLLRVKNN